MVPGSSAVEQVAVNHFVAGSIPARAAISGFWALDSWDRGLVPRFWFLDACGASGASGQWIHSHKRQIYFRCNSRIEC